MPVGDHRPMPKHSVKNYQTVLQSVINHHGSMTKATKAIGLTWDAYRKLIDCNEINYSNAKKIVNAFNQIRQN